jgi:hypothetical protein
VDARADAVDGGRLQRGEQRLAERARRRLGIGARGGDRDAGAEDDDGDGAYEGEETAVGDAGHVFRRGGDADSTSSTGGP